jgi:hypothetical protein
LKPIPDLAVQADQRQHFFFEALETESIQPFPFDRPKPRCYTAQHVENKTPSVADALGVLQQVVIHRQWVRPA